MKATLVLLTLTAFAAPARAGDVHSPSLTQVAQSFSAQTPLSCRVAVDSTGGALEIGNAGAAPVPVGSRIEWQTSSGRSGVVRLRTRLDPGLQEYEPSAFPATMADTNTTCVAAVSYVAPAPQAQGFGQPALAAPAAVGATASSTLPNGPTSFKPPLSPGGHRLVACEAVESKVCGEQVAQLYCQQRGYSHVTGFNTNHHPVIAQTLSGEMCFKETCRVFDRIDCAP
jgi:hypothetical protein